MVSSSVHVVAFVSRHPLYPLRQSVLGLLLCGVSQMKSDGKSLKVQCKECKTKQLVSSPVMDHRDIYLYCKRCHAHSLHKKLD